MQTRCKFDLVPDDTPWTWRTSTTEPGAWLEVEHVDGWTTAYRIVERPDGELVVAEIRFFPAVADASGAGTWAIEGAIDVSDVPPGGLTSRAVRTVQIGEALGRAQRILERKSSERGSRRVLLGRGFLQRPTVAEASTDAGDDVAPTMLPFEAVARESTGTARAGHSEEFFAEIAHHYERACRTGARDPATEIVGAMKTQGIFYSGATVKDFVREARKRGLLTAAPEGRAGGTMTPACVEILGRRDDDAYYLANHRTWVEMVHDDDFDPTDPDCVRRVTRVAFDEVWEPKGWRRYQRTTTTEAPF